MSKGGTGGKGASGGTTGVSTRNQTTEVVTHSFLQEELLKFRDELHAELAESTRRTIYTKVESLQTTIASKVSQLSDDFNGLKSDFKEHVSATDDLISKLTNRINDLETAALHSAIHANEKDQRCRLKSFRLHGKKTSAKNSPETMKEVYDFIIHPSFSRALEMNEISEIPSLAACSSYSHPLRPKNPTDTPAILFKFITRSQQELFMRHARHVCNTLNESRDPADPPLRVGPDLTSHNRRVMTALYKIHDVEKARLGSHGIQFSLKSSPSKWLSVTNPFADAVADYQIRVSNPFMSKVGE